MNIERIVLLTAMLGASGSCWAVEALDTFSVRVGGYITNFDTRMRADGQGDTGTRIDLHRDLGLDNSNAIAFVGLAWRPWDNHEFGLSYYQDSGDAERNLHRDIEFNGEHYDTNTRIKANLDIDSYEAYYTWWAWNRGNWALGPRVGLLWYKLELGLDVKVDANGNAAGARASNEVSADLPAPTIGAGWRWSPGEQWRIGADAGYFQANVNDIDANVTYGRGGVEWFPWERWGFSLDYTIRRISAEVRKSRYDGNVRFVDSGLRLGVTYRF